MKTYALRRSVQSETADLLPLPDDNGNRTMRVYRKTSWGFIYAACDRRGLRTKTVVEQGAFLITVPGATKEQFEEIRAEFNTRPSRSN